MDGEKLTAAWGPSCVRSPPGSGLLIYRHEAEILSRVLLCPAGNCQTLSSKPPPVTHVSL